jgi:hypothetical protein
MDRGCPKCGFKYGWDGSTCVHCRYSTAITATAPVTTDKPSGVLRWGGRILLLAGVAIVIGWLCWPGQISYFTVWLIRPGMSTARVEWLLGGPGTELTEEQLPGHLRNRFTVAGARFVRWDADPRGWRYVDYVIASVENGLVKEIHAWEVPFAGTPPNEPFR